MSDNREIRSSSIFSPSNFLRQISPIEDPNIPNSSFVFNFIWRFSPGISHFQGLGVLLYSRRHIFYHRKTKCLFSTIAALQASE